jgi:guanosine-3',5'-bis(diphosphate) 3'-pyrophosphohydrolase
MIEEHMLNEARVHEAAEFAARAHRGQMYGAQPYARHLSDVTVILRFRMDRPVNTTLLSAGWLHDVLEDTDTTRADLAWQTSCGRAPVKARRGGTGIVASTRGCRRTPRLRA